MEYAKARAALLESAQMRQAELMKELAEIESTIQHLNGGEKAAAAPKRKRARSIRTNMPLLKFNGKKTVTGHILEILESNGALKTSEIYDALQARGVTCTRYSTQGAISRAGIAGLLYRVPRSRLWALGNVPPRG